MSRLMRQSDPVEVRRGRVDGDVGSDDAPEQFLWRGRLYVVRAVLARWTEAGGWWRTPDLVIDDRERDWWRVEADCPATRGRLAALSAGRGVYDLCFDWSRGAWSLARVLD